MTLEHEHHAVALADAERGEVIRRAVGEGGNLGEREVAFLLVAGQPEHRPLVRALARERVDDVVAEVEVFRRQKLDAGQAAVLVDLLAGEVVIDQPVIFCAGRLCVRRAYNGRGLGRQLAFGVGQFRDGLKDHCKKSAVRAAGGDHPVRM